MIIKFKKLYNDVTLPKYAHPEDAGMDLYSRENKVLKSGERYNFGTGLSMELSQNYVGLIWEKSGLATKNGLISLGGVIDSGYRGEIIIVLWNLSKKSVKIEKQDKIGQLLIQPVVQAKIKEVKKLSNSSRGDGGFGSTGRK